MDTNSSDISGRRSDLGQSGMMLDRSPSQAAKSPDRGTGNLLWRTRSLVRRKVNVLRRDEYEEYAGHILQSEAGTDEVELDNVDANNGEVSQSVFENSVGSIFSEGLSLEFEAVKNYDTVGSKMIHIVREGGKVNSRLKKEALFRISNWLKWIKQTDERMDTHKGPLTLDEVKYIREELIIEIGFGASLEAMRRRDSSFDLVVLAIQDLLSSPVGEDLGRGPNHAYTRQLMRSVNTVSSNMDKAGNIREWFVAQGKQNHPEYTSNIIKQSNLILGQGPNGGYNGYLNKQLSNLSKEVTKTLSSSTTSDEPGGTLSKLWRGRSRARSPMKEWLLHGDDINLRRKFRRARDIEIAGFFSECIDLRIGSVVANGIVHSYDFTNVKSVAPVAGPFIDVFACPYIRNKSNAAYKCGAPRDFFNYFGCDSGDDGATWSHAGKGSKKAVFQEFTVTSTKVGRALNHARKPCTLYRLDIVWQSSFFSCLKQTYEHYTLNVFHIETVDQSPAELSMSQVSLLCDMLIDMQASHSGILIHCAGGVGRTGNLAMALMETCCFNRNMPIIPEEKLQFLRSFRPASVQSVEQFLDGVILSAQILVELLCRLTYRNYLLRYDTQEPEVPDMVPARELISWLERLEKSIK